MTSPAASPELFAEMVEKAETAYRYHYGTVAGASPRSAITVALEAAGVKELLAVVEAASDLNEYLDGIEEDARTPGEKKLSAILAAKLEAIDD